MTSFRKLSAAQLNKIIDETHAELIRRKNIDKATVEICSILKKYKINFRDIDLNIISRTGGTSSTKKCGKVAKSRNRRSTVQAKYKDPNSATTWTGRGRAPAWVQVICQNEGIDIDGFKKDDRFRC